MDYTYTLYTDYKPNKTHVMVVHVVEFCEIVGKGLGEFSEQETENTHSYFDSILEINH